VSLRESENGRWSSLAHKQSFEVVELVEFNVSGRCEHFSEDLFVFATNEFKALLCIHKMHYSSQVSPPIR
jgi:hypothetical protein